MFLHHRKLLKSLLSKRVLLSSQFWFYILSFLSFLNCIHFYKVFNRPPGEDPTIDEIGFYNITVTVLPRPKERVFKELPIGQIRGPQLGILWPKRNSCSQHLTVFAGIRALPSTALLSFPGSGNTWVRYLVEAATGIFTGSIYADEVLYSQGFYGEAHHFMDGTTILQKTHYNGLSITNRNSVWRRKHLRDFGGRAVIIIRDPRDCIISYWNYRESGFKHIGHSNITDMNHERRFFDNTHAGILKWRQMYREWLPFVRHKVAILIKYEELIREPGWGFQKS